MAENQEHNINMDGDSVSVKLATAGTYMDGNIIFNINDNGIDTSDATATSRDIIQGKTAYVNGEKITGAVQKISYDYAYNCMNTSNNYIVNNSDSYNACGYLNNINEIICVERTEDYPNIGVFLSKDKFGNATTSDVLSGKTFTSENGIKITGTAEMTAAPTVKTATATPTTSGGIMGWGGTTTLTFAVDGLPKAFSFVRTSTGTASSVTVIGGQWNGSGTSITATTVTTSSSTANIGTTNVTVSVSNSQVVITGSSSTYGTTSNLSGTYQLNYVY